MRGITESVVEPAPEPGSSEDGGRLLMAISALKTIVEFKSIHNK